MNAGGVANGVPDEAPQRRPDVAALYAAHRGAMRRAAAAYLRARNMDIAMADDAVSEVVRRLLQRGIPGDVPHDRWQAYLVRAAINAAKDEVKKASRRPDHPDLANDVREERASTPDPTDLENAVTAAVDAERAIQRVRPALLRLPLAQHQVVVGRHIHGQTNDELASTLGVSSARISQLHSAGIRALAVILAGDPP